MSTVYALWWDDAQRSTHLDPTPYPSKAACEREAKRRGLVHYTAFKLTAAEAPFYFPTLAKH